MGFEVIHQPKSNAVFFFREILWQKCLFFFFLFRVSASAFSVFFRVIPWLILLLISYPCSSVANSSALCLAGPQSN